MASPYFPNLIEPSHKQKLTRAAKLVTEVIDYYQPSVSEGADGQFDNSASDGGALALLGLAVRLIRENGAAK